MDHEGINSPYVVENTIKLQLKTPHGGETTDVRIIKVFEPLTLSSTMVERLASSFMDSSSTSLSISLSSSGTGGCPKGEDPLGQ
ncbi:uncharacterized protein N7525_006357 [Penicillium rubens]|uniref:uncharacterized protein n=1 Tax=Penicillium rubens TaxID=1108849 RepID=UPI002A59CEAB|nr:uncharacterized protein N7525_006357 [Penicillium rubens]KAJ5828104.1 hypothetical protein N7525_006357 [Penicillium rubens]